MKNRGDELLQTNVNRFSSRGVKQPFPMQGSKRKQAELILDLIPNDVSVFFEPFCGSAAVSLALRNRMNNVPVVINDMNADIANLWISIVNEPEQLSEEYKSIWEKQFSDDEVSSSEYFNAVRERFNTSLDKESADFLFILNRIVKGSLRYNRDGKINQSADKRRYGAKPTTVNQRLMEASNLLHNATVMQTDWQECLRMITPTDVAYLDPPYQGTTEGRDKRYARGLNYDDLVSGIESLNKNNVSVIISYDAITGPISYGRPLHLDVELTPIDITTGISSQGTLLGRSQESHETLYLTPALLSRLGGVKSVEDKIKGQRIIA